MTIDQLKSFVDVIDLGTFTAAAKRAGKSQPAISLQIKQLEKAFGTSLLERVGKKVIPTQAGLRLEEHARRILGIVSITQTDMGTFAKGGAGHIRLGTGATACIHLLPPVLKSLKEKHPSLSVTVKTGDTPEILKLLEENSIDIALVTLPAKGRMFSIQRLLSDEFVFVAPKDTSNLPKEVSPNELSDIPLILYATGGHTRQIVDRWLSEAGTKVSPIMELGSVEAIKGMVAAGQGCAILPMSGLGTDLSTTNLDLRQLTPSLFRELAVVTRQDKPRHAGLRYMEAAIESLRGVLS